MPTSCWHNQSHVRATHRSLGCLFVAISAWTPCVAHMYAMGCVWNTNVPAAPPSVVALLILIEYKRPIYNCCIPGIFYDAYFLRCIDPAAAAEFAAGGAAAAAAAAAAQHFPSFHPPTSMCPPMPCGLKSTRAEMYQVPGLYK